MDGAAKAELSAIKQELSSIIAELENISNGVRSDFAGIGSDRCADCINGVLNQYYHVRRKLNEMDMDALMGSLAQQAISGGGGGGGSSSW